METIIFDVARIVLGVVATLVTVYFIAKNSCGLSIFASIIAFIVYILSWDIIIPIAICSIIVLLLTWLLHYLLIKKLALDYVVCVLIVGFCFVLADFAKKINRIQSKKN